MDGKLKSCVLEETWKHVQSYHTLLIVVMTVIFLQANKIYFTSLNEEKWRFVLEDTLYYFLLKRYY